MTFRWRRYELITVRRTLSKELKDCHGATWRAKIDRTPSWSRSLSEYCHSEFISESYSLKME